MQQGDAEWFEARRGRLTGSRIKALLEGSWAAKQRLLATLRRERDAGPGGWMEGQDATGADIDRGRLLEDRAIALFEMIHNTTAERCGVLVSENHPDFAASPDFLLPAWMAVGEAKCPRIKGHMATWAYGMPKEHVPQVQAEIYVALHRGYDRCVFLSFNEDVEPSRQLYVEKVEADPIYQARIESVLEWFLPLLRNDEPLETPTTSEIPQLF